MKKLECSDHIREISIEERLYYARLSRDKALNLSAEEKRRYFYSIQVKHRNLLTVEKEISRYISGDTDTRILTLIGPPGAGKTSLILNVLANRLKATEMGQIPFVSVSTPAHGSNKVPWSEMYRKILRAGREPLIDQKRVTDMTGETVKVRSNSMGSLSALRDAVMSMLINRKTKILALDEVLHMLRFGNHEALMDTFKSLADETSCQILLIGSYDLFGLATTYGQVARREEIFYLGRYGHNVDEKGNSDKEADARDVEEYRNIIRKLQDKWPLEDVPQFANLASDLLLMTLGIVGLLKEFMTQCLVLQMENDGKWDNDFVRRAMKKPYVIKKIRKEVESGEKEMRNEGFFNDGAPVFAEAIRVIRRTA
ncbi:ABC-type Mn2+/Zn2+ transport system ATPase subunit [Paraburkholderia sp. RAU6.4a]|uniref:AAA family ATPase n=1 Tax=Paraburkholderia sp. RAU6.4a TaxID=2991067 RepID=UPI003D209C93